MLRELYTARWNVERVMAALIRQKELTQEFARRWGRWLEKAVEDPEALWEPDAPRELIDRLVEKNLILYNMYDRDPFFWVATPPPERDPELGVGENVAWHTPIHREAVRRALQRA